MQKIYMLAVFGWLLVMPLSLSAQSSDELLDKVPTKKEDFAASEKKVLNTIEWLENTPMNEQQEKRKQLNALFLEWLTNSPSVTIEISGYLLDYTKKNPDLLMIFMGGWTRYMLQNNYSADVFQGNLAGVKSMIKVYKAGLLKKDKNMQELVDADEQGKLQDWLKKKLDAK